MSAAMYAAASERAAHESAQVTLIAELQERVTTLETAIRKAVSHAEKKGMRDWPVFVGLRKAINS